MLWLKKQLPTKYELETLLLGADDDMAKHATYLGRTPEWHADGFGLRPDRRHVRQLLRDLGMEDCRSMSTPPSAAVEKETDQNHLPEICADLAGKHPAAAARIVHLAQDRLDLRAVAVELARTMAMPGAGDEARLKRVARYLRGRMFDGTRSRTRRTRSS